ncbi:hypothetical protein GQ53DRAFT_305968 [Thozetella sp. PMI_491]|nr:hypothetical protein GQ53DRAFT_305968 [Thozetella sp. PMI_491]
MRLPCHPRGPPRQFPSAWRQAVVGAARPNTFLRFGTCLAVSCGVLPTTGSTTTSMTALGQTDKPWQGHALWVSHLG